MDQTKFSDTQELIQPPPKPEKLDTDPSLEPVKPAKKKIQPIYLAVAGLLLLVSVLVIGATFQKVVMEEMANNQTTQPPEVVIPRNPDQPQSEFGIKLQEIEDQINESDPSEIDLDPPPLNYEIRL